MGEWIAVMTLISTGIVVALWIWDRLLFVQKLQVLAGQQAETSRTLNEFILESGKIAQEFTRLLPQGGASPEPLVQSREIPRKKGVEKRHMVLNLAQKGLSTRDIAAQLKLPAGEIDLIVNLNQSRQRPVTA